MSLKIKMKKKIKLCNSVKTKINNEIMVNLNNENNLKKYIKSFQTLEFQFILDIQ